MAGQLPRHAPHGVHGARVRATQPQRGQQVGVAEEGVAGGGGEELDEGPEGYRYLGLLLPEGRLD